LGKALFAIAIPFFLITKENQYFLKALIAGFVVKPCTKEKVS
jgi:hypothetical protein